MDDIHYSRIRDTFALSPCAVGFALRNVREIYFLTNGAGGVQCFRCSLKCLNLVEVSLEN